MSWYRCDTILDVLCVAADYPDGILSMGPAHACKFHLQELVTSREAWTLWTAYYDDEISWEGGYISLFTDYVSSLRGNYDQVAVACSACGHLLSDHPSRSIMDAPLDERLAYCLRAHVNAAKQGRPLSDTVQRMTTQTLNDYEATKAGENVPPPPPEG